MPELKKTLSTLKNHWQISLPGVTKLCLTSKCAIAVQKNVVRALSITSGRIYWSFPTQGDVLQISSSPDGGQIYLGTEMGKVYGVAAKDGRKLWIYNARGPIITPIVQVEKGKFLAFGSRDGLYSIHSRGGLFHWKFTCPSQVVLGPAILDIKRIKQIYFGCEDGQLYGVDWRRGKLIWKKNIREKMPQGWKRISPGSLALDGCYLIFSSEQVFYSVQVSNLLELSEFYKADDQDVLFYSMEFFPSQIGDRNSQITNSTGRFLYMGGEKKTLSKVHAKGRIAWHTPLETRVDSLAHVSPSILVCLQGGQLFALDSQLGTPLGPVAVSMNVSLLTALENRILCASPQDEVGIYTLNPPPAKKQ